MPPKIPSSCPTCGEQIIQLGETERIVHRYNLQEKCPNGKGVIPVGLGKGADFAALQAFKDAMDAVKAKAEQQRKAEAKQQLEALLRDQQEIEEEENADEDSEEIEPGESEDSEPTEEEADQDSSDGEGEDDGDDEREMKSGKGKGNKGKPSQSRGQPEQESDGKQGQPPPPSDDWAIPAAKDINTLWEERIRLRGYKPTDEELAKLLLQHSNGKVEYRPLADRKPAEEAQTPAGVFIPAALASTIQDLILAAFDAHRYWEKFDGGVEIQTKKQIQKFVSGLAVCQNCGNTNPLSTACKRGYTAHQYRAKHMVKEEQIPDKNYRVFVRDTKNNLVRECNDFCKFCDSPVYGEGYQIKHAADNTAHCSVGKKAVEIGGIPPSEIERGTSYAYRPWADKTDPYSLIVGKCPACDEQMYQPSGSGMTFHVNTGNTQCKKAG